MSLTPTLTRQHELCGQRESKASVMEITVEIENQKVRV